MQYNKVTEKIIDELKKIVGENNVVLDEEKLEVYSHDEVPEVEWYRMPEVVIKPENAQQISEVMKLANREMVPVTPRGAGTGLSTGAVPMHGGIVLSVEKMNKILELDKENMFMVVEPGVTTGEIQKLANDEGYLYAGDPCSGDASFIGGNIAENAGGNKAVKYGTTSKHVYGLEVVMPNGDIVTYGGKCVKDVTGFDVLHLMVGSEGTLGIVTKAWLKLLPKPKYVADLLAPFADMQTAIDVVPKILATGITPTAIEFMDSISIKAAEIYLNQKLPHGDCGAYLVLQIDSSSESLVEEQYEELGKLMQDNGALEVFVADNMSAQNRIWKARKCFAEALRLVSPIYCMEDIVVPVSEIPKAVEELQKLGNKYNVQIPCTGHAGDGNIHCTLLKGEMSDDEWHDKKEVILDEIYGVTYKLGGNLSGEHGIGAKRKDALAKYCAPEQVSVFAAIKKALDPNNILNPGKVIDVA